MKGLKKVNPWYWLCNLALIGFCIATKMLPRTVLPSIFTFLFPVLMGIWAAYVLTAIDDYIKPGKDFPVYVYYATACFMCALFGVAWVWAKPHGYTVTLGRSFIYSFSFLISFFVGKVFVFQTRASHEREKPAGEE